MKANVSDRASEAGTGVLFLIIGAILTPVLIGIPLAIFGLYMMGQSLSSEGGRSQQDYNALWRAEQKRLGK